MPRFVSVVCLGFAIGACDGGSDGTPPTTGTLPTGTETTDPLSGVTVHLPGSTVYGRTLEDWYAEQKTLVMNNELTSVCQPSANGDLTFLDFQDATCTIAAGEAVMVGMGFVFCYACPELVAPEDAAIECAYADSAGAITCLDQAPPWTQSRLLKIDGQKQDTDSMLIAPFTFEFVDGPGNSQVYFAAGAFGGGYPVDDTECLAPWEAGNACGVPAGDKTVSVSGFATIVQFDEPGEHELVYNYNDGEMKVTWQIVVE